MVGIIGFVGTAGMVDNGGNGGEWWVLVKVGMEGKGGGGLVWGGIVGWRRVWVGMVGIGGYLVGCGKYLVGCGNDVYWWVLVDDGETCG